MAQAITAPCAQELIALAERNDPAGRAQLLDTMVELCQMPSEDRASRDLIGQLFTDLARKAEREIRLALSNRLAQADWAPPALVNMLALDEIEIAGPIIAESPVLGEDDLLAILLIGPLSHRVAVAGRACIGSRLIDAMLDQGEGEVLTALAGNLRATISEESMARLVDASRRIVALRGQLASHPQLTVDLARRLYQWVGDALQAGIANRFEIDAARLQGVIGDTLQDAGQSGLAEEGDDRCLQQLADKLQAAGQLRQGTLLRLLREGRLRMFCVAMAKLAHLETAAVRRAIDADQPDLLGLACAGAGLDRGVFPHLLEAVRDLNSGLPGGGAEGGRRALGAFAPFSASVAAAAFRQAV